MCLDLVPPVGSPIGALVRIRYAVRPRCACRRRLERAHLGLSVAQAALSRVRYCAQHAALLIKNEQMSDGRAVPELNWKR